MKHPRVSAAALIASTLLGVGITVPQFASAHHNDVSCQSPGVWLIENSEADKAEEFTTNQGHSGTIPAGGSTTVEYFGTSLTVYAVWPVNGATNEATGTGDCTAATTTEPVETTEVVETSEPETTLVETTVVETTQPEETTSSSTTQPASTTSSTTVPASSSSSTSTVPPTSSTQPASSVPPTTIIDTPPCEVATSDEDLNGNNVNDACEPAPAGVLPATR